MNEKEYIEIGNSDFNEDKTDYNLENNNKKTLKDDTQLDNLNKNKTDIDDYNKNDNSKSGKWIVFLSIIIILYLIYQPLINIFMIYLKNNPSLYRYYLFIFSEIHNNTINGLLLISIMGSLFFLVLPSEAIFIYYLSSTQYFPVLIILYTVLGSAIGLTFNYFVGKLLGNKLLKLLFRKNFEKHQKTVTKWGNIVIFFGNIFPGPIEVLALFFGGFKFKYSNFIILSIIGRLIKYLLLFLAFTFFWDQITLYYQNFIDIL